MQAMTVPPRRERDSAVSENPEAFCDKVANTREQAADVTSGVGTDALHTGQYPAKRRVGARTHMFVHGAVAVPEKYARYDGPRR